MNMDARLAVFYHRAKCYTFLCDERIVMRPTNEQLQISRAVVEGKSVIVDAVAGSGKTATILLIAKTIPEKRILQVTYNTALKLEVRSKVEENNISNVEVHTYHSLARTYYDDSTTTDMGIETSLCTDVNGIPSFDIVIFDECQDMTPLLYKFARKVVKDISSIYRMPTLGLFGDNMQTIYHFKKADPRYLTLGNRLWPEFTFQRLRLSISFRVTNHIAGFVNKNLLGFEKVTAVKDGPRVNYIVTNKSNACDYLIPLIFKCFETGGFASDIFVLAPSISENNREVVRIENALVLHNIPVHIPNQDDRTLDDDVMRNKVVFSTYHQSKGRERRFCIVLGLDGSYSKVFARDLPSSDCPSTVYVACTRASEQLLVTQDMYRGCASFMHVDDVSNVNVEGGHLSPANVDSHNDESTNFKIRKTTVTKLVRHLSHELVVKLHKLIIPILVCCKGDSDEPVPLKDVFGTKETSTIDIPTKVLTKFRSYEDVSELNAFALSAMWEQECGVDTTIGRYVKGSKVTKFMQPYVDAIPKVLKNPSDFLYLANVYRALNTKQYFKMKQIQTYTWISSEQAEAVLSNYRKYVCDVKDFEYMVAVKDYKVGSVCSEITGCIDILTGSTIFEIKCTQTLQLEHIIQLLLYKWIWQKNFEAKKGSKSFKLLNVLTDQCFTLHGTKSQIHEIANLLLSEKYVTEAKLNDDEFVSDSLNSNV